ncbi:MAG: hypothetical protein LBG77_05775 [Dysgonamonadaceae bacterium]|jgi:hypothetical protein|nr:hypothetical protein [Dysgonamonadaceae bacterium]
MKRTLLIQYLNANSCYLKREGSKHSIFINMKTGKSTSIPRHLDIDEITASKICMQLEIPRVGKN